MKQAPSIVIDNLSKQYNGMEKPALDDLSLAIQPGEVYGFLGPNGAGKSTTIRLLMNFIQPTSGSAAILGQDIVKNSVEIKKSIGYLSGDLAVYPKMTGAQFLDYMCVLQSSNGRENIPLLAKRLGADLHKHFSELSRGNRQKIGIIQAFMHEPEVLVLDEPTSGLDPLVQETFSELIQEAKNRGACVFMSSHVLSEVQKMCDRVGIIRGGKLVSENNIAEMTTEAAQTFDIVFAGKAPMVELKKIHGIRIQAHDGANVTLHVYGGLSHLFALLAKHEVKTIDTRTLDLEEAFMHFYTDGKKS
jgi:ABC-2 type transport system ATP-binding protein